MNAGYSETYSIPKYNLYGENAEFLNVKAGGTYSNRYY
jgi:hypothetical protein